MSIFHSVHLSTYISKQVPERIMELFCCGFLLYGNTFHYCLIYANRGRGHWGMATLITSKIKLLGLNSYYDLISWGKKIIVSAQMDFVLLEYAFSDFVLQQIMTFGQSHTNKQLNKQSDAIMIIVPLTLNPERLQRGLENHGRHSLPNINDFLLLTLTGNNVSSPHFGFIWTIIVILYNNENEEWCTH